MLQLDEVSLYSTGLALLEKITLMIVENRRDQISMEAIFMEAREPLMWHYKQLDHAVGMSFKENFNFALVGHLIKGYRHPNPATVSRTVRVLKLLLTIAARHRGLRHKYQVTSESVSYLAALIAVPDESEVRNSCRLRFRLVQTPAGLITCTSSVPTPVSAAIGDDGAFVAGAADLETMSPAMPGSTCTTAAPPSPQPASCLPGPSSATAPAASGARRATPSPPAGAAQQQSSDSTRGTPTGSSTPLNLPGSPPTAHASVAAKTAVGGKITASIAPMVHSVVYVQCFFYMLTAYFNILYSYNCCRMLCIDRSNLHPLQVCAR